MLWNQFKNIASFPLSPPPLERTIFSKGLPLGYQVTQYFYPLIKYIKTAKHPNSK